MLQECKADYGQVNKEIKKRLTQRMRTKENNENLTCLRYEKSITTLC